jgi:hypothetical protein
VEEIREEAIGDTHRLSVRKEAAAGGGVAGGLGFFVGASERGSACGRGRKVYSRPVKRRVGARGRFRLADPGRVTDNCP